MADKPVLLTLAAIAQIQQVVRDYSRRNYKNANNPLLHGRWQGRYVIGDATHEMWFTIVSVECPSPSQTILTVLPAYYSRCNGKIPGADAYTCYCTVEDVCGILSYYTAEDLVNRVGRATYMYPYTCNEKTDCETGVWLVDTICGSPECA